MKLWISLGFRDTLRAVPAATGNSNGAIKGFRDKKKKKTWNEGIQSLYNVFPYSLLRTSSTSTRTSNTDNSTSIMIMMHKALGNPKP